MIFRPEHVEDISIVLFESVSDVFAKEYNDVCVSSCSIDKKIVHFCFSIKIKSKK